MHKRPRVAGAGLWEQTFRGGPRGRSYQAALQRNALERATIEGDSPVGDGGAAFFVCFPSNAKHGKLRMNPARPRAKAKYLLATDSGLVP